MVGGLDYFIFQLQYCHIHKGLKFRENMNKYTSMKQMYVTVVKCFMHSPHVSVLNIHRQHRSLRLSSSNSIICLSLNNYMSHQKSIVSSSCGSR